LPLSLTENLQVTHLLRAVVRHAARVSGVTVPVASLAAVLAGSVVGAGAAAGRAWIVFAGSPQQGTEPSQLFRVRVSGGATEQITVGARAARDPAFAPDGKRIVFARAGIGIFTASVAGTGIRRLTSGANDRWPVWSPDSKTVAFVRPVGRAASGYSLFVVGVNGRGERRLAAAPATLSRPAWMPGSRALVIASKGRFYEVDARTGTVLRRFAPKYDASVGELDWSLSPTGTTLDFVGRRPAPVGCVATACEVFALYVVNRTSAHARRFADDASVAGWSPDSHQLVYAHAGALNIKPLAGGAITTIPVGGVAIFGDAPPVWQPAP